LIERYGDINAYIDIIDRLAISGSNVITTFFLLISAYLLASRFCSWSSTLNLVYYPLKSLILSLAECWWHITLLLFLSICNIRALLTSRTP